MLRFPKRFSLNGILQTSALPWPANDLKSLQGLHELHELQTLFFSTTAGENFAHEYLGITFLAYAGEHCKAVSVGRSCLVRGPAHPDRGVMYRQALQAYHGLLSSTCGVATLWIAAFSYNAVSVSCT